MAGDKLSARKIAELESLDMTLLSVRWGGECRRGDLLNVLCDVWWSAVLVFTMFDSKELTDMMLNQLFDRRVRL